MGFRMNQRLVLIAIFSILVSKFVQNAAAHIYSSPQGAPNLQPVPSHHQHLSPTPASHPPLSHVSFPPSESHPPSSSSSIAESPNEGSPSPSPSGSFPPSESISPSEDISSSISESKSGSEAFTLFNIDQLSGSSPAVENCDIEIKKICNSTDYPTLCLATIAPFQNGKTDVFSVLEISLKATNEFAKYSLFTLKKLALTPGTPEKVVSVLNDCKDSYEDVLYNFESAMSALPSRDLGTVNTMLSAVMTDVGDCEDEFAGVNFPSPVSNFADKLINMTSNSLAIVTLTI